MVRLGLKLFYLRTRVHEVSQQELADTLGVRQATLSNIERGSALPTLPLLHELCRYFDVTPTFLMDEARGVEPRATERWSARDGLVTSGMWVEVSKDETIVADDEMLLCPLTANARFYDDEARERRQSANAQKQIKALLARRRRRENALKKDLQDELQKHPRSRKGSARGGRT